MCDFLGRELKIGDKVVYVRHYRTSCSLIKTIITGITPKRVYVEYGGNSCVAPNHVIKYEE